MKLRSVLIACALMALAGCSSPALTTDKANVASLQAQIATASTQPASTQPTAASPIPLLTQLQQQLADALKQEAADRAAQNAAMVQLGTQITAAVASAAPAPWSAPLVALISVAGMAITHKISGSTATTVSNNTSNTLQAAVAGLASSVPVGSLPPAAQKVIEALKPVIINAAGSMLSGTSTTLPPAGPFGPVSPPPVT